jgi:hypothetical protein
MVVACLLPEVSGSGVAPGVRGGPVALVSQVSAEAATSGRVRLGRLSIAPTNGLMLCAGDRLELTKGSVVLIVPSQGVLALTGKTNWPPEGLADDESNHDVRWTRLFEGVVRIFREKQEIVKGAVGKGGASDRDAVRLICVQRLASGTPGVGGSEAVVFWSAPAKARPPFELLLRPQADPQAIPRLLRLDGRVVTDAEAVMLYAARFAWPEGSRPDGLSSLIANPRPDGYKPSNALPCPPPPSLPLLGLIEKDRTFSTPGRENERLANAILLEADGAAGSALSIYLTLLGRSSSARAAHLELARFFAAQQVPFLAQWHRDKWDEQR